MPDFEACPLCGLEHCHDNYGLSLEKVTALSNNSFVIFISFSHYFMTG